MKATKDRKRDLTRARVLDAALELFRKEGFEATTMRDVAAAAELSLGAAYYHFPSKEAILLAYYARNQDEHAARALPLLADEPDLRRRLGVLVHTKLEAVRRDRKLLGAIVSHVANPDDPASAFADETRTVRAQAIGLFARALEGTALDENGRRMAALALWVLHMGLLLYFVRDRSKGQEKTRRLVDDTLDLVVPVLALAATPIAGPLLQQLAGTLGRAGLTA